jgi:putative transposase
LDLLTAQAIQISMDGKGRALDNILTERLWRSVKYEEIYLHDDASPRKARQGLATHLPFYNTERPPQALEHRPPRRSIFKPPARPQHGHTPPGCAGPPRRYNDLPPERRREPGLLARSFRRNGWKGISPPPMHLNRPRFAV